MDMINSFSNLIACPACKLKKSLTWKKESVTCKKCRISFPILFNDLPLLVTNYKAFALQSHIILKEQREKIIRLTDKLKQTHPENDVMKRQWTQLHGAIVKNFAWFNEMELALQSIIGMDVDTQQLSKSARNYLDFFNNFKYLKSDWSGFPDCEERIHKIESILFDLTDTYSQDCNTGIVLGAGAGRIAYDLTTKFDHIVAVDNSVVMGRFYQLLSKEDPCFYLINPNNAMTMAEQVFLIQVSQKHAVGDKNRIKYCLSDASNLPVPDHSVSAIFSIYFTDIIPIKTLWDEVTRILRPGGIFIHYGPLGYQYAIDDIIEWQTAESIRNYISSSGFKIVHDSVVTDKFWLSPNSTVHNQCWVFAATI